MLREVKKLGLPADVFQQRFDGERLALQRLPGIGARQHQQLVDQTNQPIDLIVRVRNHLGALARVNRRLAAQQLDVAAHGRQRRAQLVRRIGHEAPLRIERLLELAIRGLELGQHRIEGDRQLADLVGRADVLHAAAEVVFGADGLRGMRDPLDGPERRAGQHPARCKRHDDHQAAPDDQDPAQGSQRLLALADGNGQLDDQCRAIGRGERPAVDQQGLILNRRGFEPTQSALSGDGSQPGVAQRQGHVAEIGGARQDGRHPGCGSATTGRAACRPACRWG